MDEYFNTMEYIRENNRLRQIEYSKWFDENMQKLINKKKQ